MLPFAVALLSILIGAAMLYGVRRTERPSDDVLQRSLNMEGKWVGVLSVVGGVVMLVVLVDSRDLMPESPPLLHQ